MLESEFNYFYSKYHNDLFNYLFYLVKNREQAEDLVQEVYISVLRSYENFEGRSSEKTWLFSIARNLTFDFFRKQKALKEHVSDSKLSKLSDARKLPEEITLERDEMHQVFTCLEHYSVEQRMVIILRYIKKSSIAETALVLGWSEGKVKNVQHRTIKKLAKEIQVQEIDYSICKQ